MDNILDLVNSDEWPVAIDPALICLNKDENQKNERGEAIVDIMLGDYIEGLNILDFGAGEGHTCRALKNKKAAKVVGYDIVDKFTTPNNFILTTDWDVVQQNGPYDLILVYDVFDHIEKINSLEALVLMKSVLAGGGQIFLRYHPWIGRHGGHLYEKINKAYLHNILTEDELDTIIPREERPLTHKVVNTEGFYKAIALHAGFSLLDENIQRKELEPFFKTTPIATRLVHNAHQNKFNEGIFDIEFIDHVLIH